MDNINPIGSNSSTDNSSQNNNTQSVEQAFMDKLNAMKAEEQRKKNTPTTDNGTANLSAAQESQLLQLIQLIEKSGSTNLSVAQLPASAISALNDLAKSLGLNNNALYQQLLQAIANQPKTSNPLDNIDIATLNAAGLSKTNNAHLDKNIVGDQSNVLPTINAHLSPIYQDSISSPQGAMSSNAFSQAQATLIASLQQQVAVQNAPNFIYRFTKWGKTESVGVNVDMKTTSGATLEPSTPLVGKRLNEQLSQHPADLPNMRVIDMPSSSEGSNTDKPN